jgi:hypothetical protein
MRLPLPLGTIATQAIFASPSSRTPGAWRFVAEREQDYAAQHRRRLYRRAPSRLQQQYYRAAPIRRVLTFESDGDLDASPRGTAMRMPG